MMIYSLDRWIDFRHMQKHLENYVARSLFEIFFGIRIKWKIRKSMINDHQCHAPFQTTPYLLTKETSVFYLEFKFNVLG